MRTGPSLAWATADIAAITKQRAIENDLENDFFIRPHFSLDQGVPHQRTFGAVASSVGRFGFTVVERNMPAGKAKPPIPRLRALPGRPKIRTR